jgi:hypothetical protein
MSNGGSTAVPSNPTTEDSSWTDHPVAIAAAAVTGAAILGVALYFFYDTGDEPPIRVKNGSLELQLITNNKHWKENPDLKHWKISGGHRSKDPLDVTIAVNSGANCALQATTGNALTVNYSNGTKIDVHATGKKSYVDASADLSLSTDRRLLTYTGEGFISSVVLDGNTMCTFTSKAQLADLIVSDY